MKRTDVTNNTSNAKGRYFGLVVYPDNAAQMHVFETVILSAHFQDLYKFKPVDIRHIPETDEKKEHIHVMLLFDEQRTANGLRKMLGYCTPSGYVWQLYTREDRETIVSRDLCKEADVKHKVKDKQGNETTVTEHIDVHREDKKSSQPYIPVLGEDGLPIYLDYLPEDTDIDAPSPDYVPEECYCRAADGIYTRFARPVTRWYIAKITCRDNDGMPDVREDIVIIDNVQYYSDQTTAQNCYNDLLSQGHTAFNILSNDSVAMSSNSYESFKRYGDAGAFTDSNGRYDVVSYPRASYKLVCDTVASVTDKQIWLKKDAWTFPHVERITNPYDYFIYMLHMDPTSISLGKHQYSISDIHGDSALITKLTYRQPLQDKSALSWIRDKLASAVTTIKDLLDKAFSECRADVMQYLQDKTYFIKTLISDSNAEHFAKQSKKEEQKEAICELFTAAELEENRKQNQSSEDFNNNVKSIAQEVVTDEDISERIDIPSLLAGYHDSGVTAIKMSDVLADCEAVCESIGVLWNRDLADKVAFIVDTLAPRVDVIVTD